MPSINGTTPLHYACRRGDLDTCQLLLGSRFLDVNVPDDNGVTPFHLACVNGDVKLCELLMDYEANILDDTSTGKNSLHLASLHGYTDIVKKLLQAGMQKIPNRGWE